MDRSVKEVMDVVTKDGVAVVPGYYSPELCDELRDEIDRQIVNFEHLPQTKAKNNPCDTRLFGAEKYSPPIDSFHSDPFLWALCEAYHQAEVINMCTLSARIEATDDNLGSGAGWHRDSVHIRQFKTIVYLSDVDENNGPFQYMEGSHDFACLKKLIASGHSKFNQFRYSEAEIAEIDKLGLYPLKTFTAKKGTLLCVDTRGLHRGKPLSQGVRYALTNYFYAKHHATPKQIAKFDELLVKQ